MQRVYGYNDIITMGRLLSGKGGRGGGGSDLSLVSCNAGGVDDDSPLAFFIRLGLYHPAKQESDVLSDKKSGVKEAMPGLNG